MKIKAGQDAYQFPPRGAPMVGAIQGAYFDEGVRRMTGISYALAIVSEDEMQKMKSVERAHDKPRYVAFYGGRVHVSPPSLHSGHLMVRYYPQMVEV